MLELLIKNAIRHPVKLLALCYVAYLASMSFVVSGLLVLLAVGWVRQKMKAAAKAEADARAEARRAEAVKAKAAMAEAAEKAEAADVAPATNDSAAAPSTPIRQYARSAVVIPFKSGTR